MCQGREGATGVDVRGCPMELVRARLGDLIEYGSSGPAKLSAEVRGLDIHFLHGVRVGYRIGGTGDGDIVVFYGVNHKNVVARGLSIYGKSECAVLGDGVRATF